MGGGGGGSGGGRGIICRVGEVGVLQDALLSHPATAQHPPLPTSPSLHRLHSLSDSLSYFSPSPSLFLSLSLFFFFGHPLSHDSL